MKTKEQMLTAALFLAITAPTEDKSRKCVAIAGSIATGMSQGAVDRCKAAASLASQTAVHQFIKERSAAN